MFHAIQNITSPCKCLKGKGAYQMSIENFDKVWSKNLTYIFFPEFLHILLNYATPFFAQIFFCQQKAIIFLYIHVYYQLQLSLSANEQRFYLYARAVEFVQKCPEIKQCKLKARGTHTPTHSRASTSRMRIAISRGQWQRYYFSQRHAIKNSSGQMRQISRRTEMIHLTIG